MSSSNTPKTSVRTITVGEDDDGQRLDRWLKKAVPDLPYALAQKLIRQGQFRVDGKRAKTDTRLSAGQEVRIPPLEHKPEGAKPKLRPQDIDFIRSLVIYDDGDVIALNKPYGLPVQGGSKIKRHVDGMLDGLKDKNGIRPRLVHRLDKDTSGVLLLARSAKVAQELGRMFKGRDIRKIYWAIVTPTPETPMGTIKAPVIKAGGTNKERMVVNDKEGKFAITEYEIVESAMNKAAFVAFWPRTGRTHQIRVHAELMNTPILGDTKYRGVQEVNPHDGNPDEVFGLDGYDHAGRLHLHAQRVICPHPVKRGKLDISAPLPPELVKTWKALGFNHRYKGELFADVE